MSANLLRNCLLMLGVLALVLMGFVAYARYQAQQCTENTSCILPMNSNNNDMPWEALARQLMGAVSL